MNDSRSERLSVYLPEHLIAQVKALAEYEKRSVSNMMSVILKDKFYPDNPPDPHQNLIYRAS